MYKVDGQTTDGFWVNVSGFTTTGEAFEFCKECDVKHPYLAVQEECQR